MTNLRFLLINCSILLLFSPGDNVRAQDSTEISLEADTASSAPAPEAVASPTSIMFEKRCYSCHTVGQGDKKGPDLKGITQRRDNAWLLEYIPSATTMLKNGDSAAVAIFEKYAPEQMTDQALDADQINQLLDFIAGLSASNMPFIPSGARLSREPLAEDIPLGVKLFIGETHLENGGPACLSCHTVSGVGRLGGGTLGPDLTQASVRFSLPELINILQYFNYPLMSQVYAGKTITDEEIVRLVALFQEVSLRQPEVDQKSLTFLYLGIALAIGLIFLVNWLWRNRFTEVRKPLISVASGKTGEPVLSSSTHPPENGQTAGKSSSGAEISG